MISGKLRSPYVFTEKRMVKWSREGRGLGDGVDYRPWLQTRNVKSRGRKHRLRGIIHDRVVHLMSDLERNAFLHFERCDQVRDIKEQFPLDREATRAIARKMGVPHPCDPVSGCDIVMTTDLLIDFIDSKGRPLVRLISIKPAGELLNRRVLDKQEIERRYWASLGFRWGQLLDTVLRNRVYFEALRAVRDWYYVDSVAGLNENEWNARRWRVLAALHSSDGGKLGELIGRIERGGGFGPGDVLSTLKHLAARKLIDFDANAGIFTPDSDTSIFQVRAGMMRLTG